MKRIVIVVLLWLGCVLYAATSIGACGLKDLRLAVALMILGATLNASALMTECALLCLWKWRIPAGVPKTEGLMFAAFIVSGSCSFVALLYGSNWLTCLGLAAGLAGWSLLSMIIGPSRDGADTPTP